MISSSGYETSLKDVRVLVPKTSRGRRAFADVKWGGDLGVSE